MSGLIFDGHNIGDLFAYGDPKISILKSNVERAKSKSRNGSMVIGKTWGDSTVKFSIGVKGSAIERRNALSLLGMWLDVDEPKKLFLPDTPDRYYMAIPSGGLDLERLIGAEIGQLTFEITDPVAYGVSKTISFSASSSPSYEASKTFLVNGTYPTNPVIKLTYAIGTGTDKLVGLLLDDVDFVHAQMADNYSHTVTIDCEARTVTVDSALSMLTLDSDWLNLTPGVHTIERDYGQMSVSITYPERWL